MSHSSKYSYGKAKVSLLHLFSKQPGGEHSRTSVFWQKYYSFKRVGEKYRVFDPEKIKKFALPIQEEKKKQYLDWKWKIAGLKNITNSK